MTASASLLLLTTKISVVVQIITGLLGIQGIFYTLPEQHKVVVDLLKIETGVQLVELVFYLFFLRFFQPATMAIYRYYDWILTTPTMLFTTMAFFRYKEINEANTKLQPITIRSFLQENKKWISLVFFFNLMMLFCGYAGEIGWMNRLTATFVGFIFFGLSFYIIYSQFAVKSLYSQRLYTFLLIVWSIYGIAYLLPSDWKNISYNGLDIVAKNFFGLYLYFLVRDLQKKTNKPTTVTAK